MGIFGSKTVEFDLEELLCDDYGPLSTASTLSQVLQKTLSQFPSASGVDVKRFNRSFFRNLRKEMKGAKITKISN